MDAQLEKEGLRHIARIEEELADIRDRTPTAPRAFWHGLLQGAGAVVGSLCALILIGWLLSALGVIPGLTAIAHYLEQYTSGVRVK